MSVIQDFMDASADFCAGCVVICALMIPFALLSGSVEGAIGLALIVVIFCILIWEGEDKDSQTKSNPTNSQNKNNVNREYHPKIKKCPKCGMNISYTVSKCPWCHMFNEKKSTKESSANLKQENQGKQNSKKKICPNCGKEIDSNRGRCPYCNHFFGAKRY